MESAISNSALLSFLLYLIGVFVVAWASSRFRGKKEFVSEYFLGSRNLGVWAFALTFAATNASGGTFMGFPALVYTHGWVLALWIASYMVVPIVTTGLLAKRLNHVARRAHAVTVPEVLRERFGSAAVGLTATAILTFFMFFYLLAQFKAGSSILATLLSDVDVFKQAVAWVAGHQSGIPGLSQAEPDYVLCLFIFVVAVVAYTAYGGFRAVVWTDVMQGILMVLGVLVLCALALWEVGGLENATRKLARMTPPENGVAELRRAGNQATTTLIPKGVWLAAEDASGRPVVFRTAASATVGGGTSTSVPILIVTTKETAERIQLNPLQSELAIRIRERVPYRSGAGERGVYVRAPGPHPDHELGFLSMGMALSYFVFWAFGGAGQPSNMVRQMAFKNSAVLRRSIVAVSIYYSAIYFPIVVIFCCARVLVPGMEIHPDRVMPETARVLSLAAGMPWLMGLIVAAPFAAVMSSVDSFLLMVSSGIVRDVYQKNINPHVSDRRLKMLTYTVTGLTGVLAGVAVLHPPQYLQHLIIFASGGLAGCFLVPVALTLYWPRMNGWGAIAGMLGGGLTHLILYGLGYYSEGRFTVYQFFGVQPFIWDVAGSAAAAVGFSLLTRPPDARLIARYFGISQTSD